MPLDAETVAKGKLAEETPEMRAKREAMIAKSPPPQPFRLRAELLKKGRSNQVVADTGNMWVNLKVYASGGENGLHNHTDQDHFHLVLSGSACFYGPRGEELHCGQYEGIMLPSGSFYRFNATSQEPLILLRVGAKTDPTADHPRYNVYGDPLPSDSKENGRGEVIPRTGEFWGAPAKRA
jgi:mannose-6-phosphate isomerase-like protein (cupin superfamily)